MGVRTLTDGDSVVIYCSTSGWAFGPVFHELECGCDAESIAKEFCDRAPGGDPRSMSDPAMEKLYGELLVEHSEAFRMRPPGHLYCPKDEVLGDPWEGVETG